MLKTEETDWYCENRDCGWSVTLSLSGREEVSPRCVCGRPLKRANVPVVSTYLQFLRAAEPSGDERHNAKE